MPTSRPVLRPLTGLRFIAALYVVALHVRLGSPDGGMFARFLGRGGVGVSLFFVLSGFILAYNYVTSDGGLRGGTRSFLGARLARLYPVYALGLVLALPTLLNLLQSHGVDASPLRFRAQFGALVTSVILLLQAWLPQTASIWNPPGWSLSCEVFFYALFPWAVRLAARLSPRRLWSIAVVCAVLAVIAPVTLLLVKPALRDADADTAGAVLSLVKFWPPLRLPEFLLGALAGRLYSVGALQGLVRRRGLPELVFLAIVVVLAWAPVPFLLIHNGLLAPLFCLLFVTLTPGEGALARALSTRWMERCGEASYSLYILHYPLLTLLSTNAALNRMRHGSPTVYFLLFAIMATLVSMAVFTWWERPARGWIRGRLDGRPSSARRLGVPELP